MGSFNVACSVSGLSLNVGDSVVFIPLIKYPYNYRLRSGNYLLLYPYCYYMPATLPLFGTYEDYGNMKIVLDENVKWIEKVKTGKSIQDIYDNDGRWFHAGMFIHKKVWDIMLLMDTDDCNKRMKLREKLSGKYDSMVLTFKKYYKSTLSEIDKILLSMDISEDTYFFRSFNKEFRKLYTAKVIEGALKNEMIDWAIFEHSLVTLGRIYFPTANGYQFGANNEVFKFYKELLVKFKNLKK